MTAKVYDISVARVAKQLRDAQVKFPRPTGACLFGISASTYPDTWLPSTVDAQETLSWAKIQELIESGLGGGKRG